MIEYLGLWILALMSLNMWGLISVLRSDAGLMRGTLWAAILICLPGLGWLAWYLIGPRMHA